MRADRHVDEVAGLAVAPVRPVVDLDDAREHVEALGERAVEVRLGAAGTRHRPAVQAEQAARGVAGREVVDRGPGGIDEVRGGVRATQGGGSLAGLARVADRRVRHGADRLAQTACPDEAIPEVVGEDVLAPHDAARVREAVGEVVRVRGDVLGRGARRAARVQDPRVGPAADVRDDGVDRRMPVALALVRDVDEELPQEVRPDDVVVDRLRDVVADHHEADEPPVDRRRGWPTASASRAAPRRPRGGCRRSG